MSEAPDAGRRLLVLSRSWQHEGSEAAFALRSVVSAASRHWAIDVVVPGPFSTHPQGDGAFDVRAVGSPLSVGRWPTPGGSPWQELGTAALCLVESGDQGALALARHHVPGTPIVGLWGTARAGEDPGGHDAVLIVAPTPPGKVGATPLRPLPGFDLGLHVAVNPLASRRRHNAIGFVDYILVLSDRVPTRRVLGGAPPVGPTVADHPPSPSVAWLAARFARQYLVVVEDATAAVWRSRSLRGLVSVDTRTDLWRFLAHARMTIDLRPGPVVARECVESLLFRHPDHRSAGHHRCRARRRGRGTGLCRRGRALRLREHPQRPGGATAVRRAWAARHQ